ncbi:hypothetical protein AXK57_19790 [Tsukamurella pulmonis]|uniref:hypothetical protein n=1 Tax=Tsukamurella pulmonis TaxID=47312 RepID=UPI000798FC35|nr:hypothetical protein [Tsukamurella pulmonis]KXP12194.1 hypothetical protein AXK57_19790 [Tsukamurella pulmonis]
MSTSSDLLLYTGYETSALEDFNERLHAIAEGYVLSIDTGEANGPRPFCGYLYAAGKRGGELWDDDLQAILDAVKWREPHQVVAILRHVDLDPAEARVYRPRYRIDTGYYEDTVTQLGPEEKP